MSTVYFEPIYTAREIEYLNDDKLSKLPEALKETWNFGLKTDGESPVSI